MAQSWYVRRDDEYFGPFSPDEVRQLARDGWLRKCDFVRIGTDSPWSPATRLQGVTFGLPTRHLSSIETDDDQVINTSFNKVVAYDRFFRVLAPLLEGVEIQFVIVMNEYSLSLPCSDEAQFRYAYSLRRSPVLLRGHGIFKVETLIDRLPEAGLFDESFDGRISLTSMGEEFAIWMDFNGYRAEYFTSPLASWGAKPHDWPEEYP